MHTNFDQLASLRMAEHEAFARRSRLQRIAREARGQRAAEGGPGAWMLAHRRLIAIPAVVASIGSAAIVVIGA